jgi:hypothetical protein
MHFHFIFEYELVTKLQGARTPFVILNALGINIYVSINLTLAPAASIYFFVSINLKLAPTASIYFLQIVTRYSMFVYVIYLLLELIPCANEKELLELMLGLIFKLAAAGFCGHW